jgi:methionyl-tRNA formyltransferase
MRPKIIFIGTPEFGVIVLEKLIENGLKPALVITAPDKPVGRKQTITPPPIKTTAKKYKIPVIQPEKIKEAEPDIKKIKPDLIIVAAFGEIIPKKILDIPKYDSLNVHPSLLPEYRGASPIQFVILNGEKKTGVSIIKITEKLDQGPILASLEYLVENSEITCKELEEELASWGAELLIEIIPDWISSKIKPKPQDESKATYTRIIKKEDGKINWEKTAEEIERQVRAFNPWPTAFCKTDSKTMKIWKASTLEQTEHSPTGPPGKVYLAPNDRIAVQCGKDYLIIEELQFSGKRKMKIEEFLKGNIDFIGTILK